MMLLVITSLLPTMAFAAVHTAVVDYKQGDTALEGYTAYNKGMTEKSPGVLVVHDWIVFADDGRMPLWIVSPEWLDVR
jgi:hypothetical protein